MSKLDDFHIPFKLPTSSWYNNSFIFHLKSTENLESHMSSSNLRSIFLCYSSHNIRRRSAHASSFTSMWYNANGAWWCCLYGSLVSGRWWRTVIQVSSMKLLQSSSSQRVINCLSWIQDNTEHTFLYTRMHVCWVWIVCSAPRKVKSCLAELSLLILLRSAHLPGNWCWWVPWKKGDNGPKLSSVEKIWFDVVWEDLPVKNTKYISSTTVTMSRNLSWIPIYGGDIKPSVFRPWCNGRAGKSVSTFKLDSI